MTIAPAVLVILISATISWAINTHLMHHRASADTPTCNINHRSQLSDHRGIDGYDLCYTRRAAHIQHRANIVVTVDSIFVYCDLSNKVSTIARASQAQRQPSACNVAALNRKHLFQPSDIIRQHRFNQHPRSTA